MRTDILIIGSGAGGGALALALSRAGFEVLVLEKGPRHSREEYFHDEIQTSNNFLLPTLEADPHVLVDSGRGEARPELSQLGWTASCVGGGTVLMGGYFFRFHPADFHMSTRFGNHQGLADWPYGYRDLEPYYSRAEWEMGVSGESGSNPHEGFRSRPYPMPPVRCHPISSFLERASRRLGRTAFPTPRAVNSRPYQGRPACRYCDSCGGYGCPFGARGTSQEALIARAEKGGRCQIRDEVMVRKVTVNERGEADGCLFLDQRGGEGRVAARVVCVCCSAVESARLLLLSSSPLFPDGLANGAGQVGRNLQFHANSTARARFRRSNHLEKPLVRDLPFLGRSIMDHYFLPPQVAALPKGGLLRFGISSPDPLGVALVLSKEGGARIWGARLKRRLRRYYRECLELHFEVFQDFIPNEGTYVGLDPRVRDRWGLPAARIHLKVPDHHRVAGRWLVERGLEVFDEMKADETVVNGIGITTRRLVHGTCRAGKDPASSVLNSFCAAHEVPNLFVVDGSFMPTSGGAPPTLTIVANALRTADHIIEQSRRGALG